MDSFIRTANIGLFGFIKGKIDNFFCTGSNPTSRYYWKSDEFGI